MTPKWYPMIKNNPVIPKNDALMRTILIGTSNCRGLKLSGDDSMVVENELLSQGGLSIGEDHEKLEEISSEQLKQCDGVIIHLGRVIFLFNVRGKWMKTTQTM